MSVPRVTIENGIAIKQCGLRFEREKNLLSLLATHGLAPAIIEAQNGIIKMVALDGDLGNIWPYIRDNTRYSLLTQLFSLVTKMHLLGVEHNDLHPYNIGYTHRGGEIKLFLLDLEEGNRKSAFYDDGHPDLMLCTQLLSSIPLPKTALWRFSSSTLSRKEKHQEIAISLSGLSGHPYCEVSKNGEIMDWGVLLPGGEMILSAKGLQLAEELTVDGVTKVTPLATPELEVSELCHRAAAKLISTFLKDYRTFD